MVPLTYYHSIYLCHHIYKYFFVLPPYSHQWQLQVFFPKQAFLQMSYNLLPLHLLFNGFYFSYLNAKIFLIASEPFFLFYYSFFLLYSSMRRSILLQTMDNPSLVVLRLKNYIYAYLMDLRFTFNFLFSRIFFIKPFWWNW